MYPTLSTFEWSETEDEHEWEKFVNQNGGSVFHTWSWRRVLESVKLRPFYAACRDSDGAILAVCPFFYRQGKVLRYLDSLPDSNNAGPIIGDQSINIAMLLTSLRKSVRFTPLSPVVAMRIRTRQSELIEALVDLGFQHTKTQVFVVDLQKTDPLHIWSTGFLKHDRQAVKHYEGMNAAFTFARNEDDYTEYLSLENGVHYTRRNECIQLLNRMRTHMGNQLRVALVSLEGKVIAGASMLCHPPSSTLCLKMTLFNHPPRKIHSPVTYLNWKVINWARENGFRYVEFGSFSYDPDNQLHFHSSRLKTRFEVSPVPRYEFILPTSDTYYSIARRLSRAR